MGGVVCDPKNSNKCYIFTTFYRFMGNDYNIFMVYWQLHDGFMFLTWFFIWSFCLRGVEVMGVLPLWCISNNFQRKKT